MTASTWNPAAALDRVGQDRELLQHLITIFLEDTAPLLDQLQRQLELREHNDACRTAHSIKGLALNFDASECAAAAEQIEQRCRAHDPRDYSNALSRLQTAITELERDLKNWA